MVCPSRASRLMSVEELARAWGHAGRDGAVGCAVPELTLPHQLLDADLIQGPLPPAASGSGWVSFPAWGNRGPREVGRRRTPGAPVRIAIYGLFSAVRRWPSSLTLPTSTFRAAGAVRQPLRGLRTVCRSRDIARPHIGRSPPRPGAQPRVPWADPAPVCRGSPPASTRRATWSINSCSCSGRPGEVLHGAGQASPGE